MNKLPASTAQKPFFLSVQLVLVYEMKCYRYFVIGYPAFGQKPFFLSVQLVLVYEMKCYRYFVIGYPAFGQLLAK
jgi:hypothetical protein